MLFGILNVTPDSFSDGGRFCDPEVALDHALRLEAEGADVVDLGGESTRPGADAVSVNEELLRVLPVLRRLRDRLKVPISVDTTKAAVAEAALREGAVIVNDISGMTADPRMSGVVASSGAGVILMHRRGTSATMQALCAYEHVVREVQSELEGMVENALAEGIEFERIAIDPGIGFAKTREQNLLLLEHLREFQGEHPVMIGVSRKSFLGGKVEERGDATLRVELQALEKGVQMIRTHDVRALRRALTAC